MREKLIQSYLDYVNNYLTVEAFAFDKGVSIKVANTIIDLGRELNNEDANQ